MRNILLSTGLLVCSLFATAYAENIDGTWDLKMYGPHGEENMVLVIQTSDEELSITANHSVLGDVAGTGTLKGNAVTIRTNPAGPKEIALEFTGTVNGDRMSGTRELKMYGDGSIQVVHDDAGNANAASRDPDVPSTMEPIPETWSKEWTAEKQ